MPHPGFEELVYNQGYFKAFLYFLFLVSIPPPPHTQNPSQPIPMGLEGGWLQYVQQITYTHTLPYIFSSVLFFFPFFEFLYNM